MSVHFISQTNLGPNSPKHNFLFLKYLAEYMGKIEALYVIDGLFEVWTGDENRHHATEEVIAALAVFTQHTPVFVQTGFQDFLLGQTFAKRTGVTLLPPIATACHQHQDYVLVSSTAMTAWHVDYQNMRQTYLDTPNMALTPSQQQQRAQHIIQTAALNRHHVQTQQINAFISEYGMQFAACPIIIYGHMRHKISSNTIWRNQPAIQYGLTHWQQEDGIYLELSDTKQSSC